LSKNLVLIRANDAAVFPRWIADEQAEYDIAISYYGNTPNAFADCKYYNASEGAKWKGVHALIAENPEILDRYELIWMPDDDIDARVSTINRFFRIAQKYRLEVAQPALEWRSYFSHWNTVSNPAFVLRHTNWIEVMAPLLSANVLRKSLPAFARLHHCWALEHIWPRLPASPRYKTAIVDAASVYHTRPVGRGSLDHKLGDPAGERMRILNLHFDREPPQVIYSAVTRGGLHVKHPLLLRFLLAAGWKATEWGDWPCTFMQGSKELRRYRVRMTAKELSAWHKHQFDLSPTEIKLEDPELLRATR